MQDRTPMPTCLQGIAQKAARQKGSRSRNRYGMLNEDFLTQGWRDIRQDAAAGGDQVSAQAYEQHLDTTIHNLVERLKQKRYRAKLVRQSDIPKGDGTQRPLGLPAVEDKRLQLAVARLLEAIYEPDFLRYSYGYRPRIGALDAVDPLTIKLQIRTLCLGAGGGHQEVLRLRILICLCMTQVLEALCDGVEGICAAGWVRVK